MVLLVFLIGFFVFYKARNNHKVTLSKVDTTFLFFSLVLGFIARVVGYNWGAGAIFHPDESKIVYPPVSMALKNFYISNDFYYPSQVSHQLLAFLYKISSIIGGISLDWNHMLIFHYIGRIYMAVISTLIILCIYHIGNRFYPHSGTIASFFVALFPPFVQAAHCITGDNFVALCACLSMLFAMDYYEESNSHKEYLWLLLLALLGALATMEKYHGIMICGLLAIIVIIKNLADTTHSYKSRFLWIFKQGVWSFGFWLFFLELTAPTFVLNLSNIWSELHHLAGDYGASTSFRENLLMYISWFFSHAGILTILFIIVGILAMIHTQKLIYSTLCLGVVNLLGICLQGRAYIRWAYPLYLCLLIVVGIGIVYLAQLLKSSKMTNYLFYVVVGISLLNLASGTFLVDAMYSNSEQDNRVISKKWCEERNITASDCIYDRYTCWRYGGWQPQGEDYNYVNDSIVEVDGVLYSTVPERDYAISLGESSILGSDRLLASFKPDFTEDGARFGNWSDFSKKVIDVYSIYYCADLAKRIITGDATMGRGEICIYDISDLTTLNEN